MCEKIYRKLLREVTWDIDQVKLKCTRKYANLRVLMRKVNVIWDFTQGLTVFNLFLTIPWLPRIIQRFKKAFRKFYETLYL